MSRARPSHDESVAGDQPSADGEAATKVVLMELVAAGRPLSATELEERTLLAGTTVDAALAALDDVGLSRTVHGDDRRPERYAAADPDVEGEASAPDGGSTQDARTVGGSADD
jgi:DNA-binding transcriptional ArsR family regulator